MSLLCWLIGIVLIAAGLALVADGNPRLGLALLAVGLVVGPVMGSLVF